MGTHDMNALYLRTINSRNRLSQLQKMCAPDIVLRAESRILRSAVEELLGDDEITQLISHIGADAFKNYFNHIAGIQIGFPIAVTSAAPLAA